MTKQEFDKRYPYGANEISYAFKKAVFEIFSTDEIDRAIKYAPRRERKHLKKLKEKFKENSGVLTTSFLLIIASNQWH